MSLTRPVLPDVSNDRAIALALGEDFPRDRTIAKAISENTSNFRATPDVVASTAQSSPFAECDATKVDVVSMDASRRSSPPSVGSSAGESCPDMDGDLAYDQQVSVRITSAPSVKLVKPSVVKSFPNEESINLSRDLLSQRVAVYGLQEKLVRGDGNCQFRSISDQLYRSPKHHKKVRNYVVSQLKAEHQLYECYVPDMSYETYLKEMGRSGTWGDHVTLKAAADYFGTQICVLSSYSNHEGAIIQVEPRHKKSERVLYLSFWAEIHYNSLYPDTVKLPEKKFMGSRQLHRFLSWGFGGRPGRGFGARPGLNVM